MGLTDIKFEVMRLGSYEIKYVEGKHNEQVPEVNGYLVNSKYNPQREAESFVEREIDKQHLNVIIGYGKGYISSELVKKEFPENKVLFIEPVKEFEAYNDEEFDVIYDSNIEEISLAINKKLAFYSRKIKVICAPNYAKIFPDLYLKVLQKVKELQNLNIVYNNTIQKLSLIWQENAVYNVKNIYKAHNLDELEKYYNCPVIVASGGPSLVKQIPLLKQIRNKVVLIAAGSTINALLMHDVEPDYVISIDGSEDNYTRHFQSLKLNNTALLFSSTSRYKIQNEYTNNQFAFLDTREDKLYEYFIKKYDITLPRVIGGGSVANFSLSIARYISTGPICLIGQDLAYTDGKTHAEGNKNSAAANEEYLKKIDAFEVEGYFGENVITDYSFYSMKESFEEIMESIEGKDSIFNCTEGGVKIKGMNQLAFNEFTEAYIVANEDVYIYKPIRNEKDLKKVKLVLKKEIEVYKELIAELKTGFNALKRNSLTTEFEQSVLNTLDKVDVKAKKLLKKVIMERIIDPITIDVMTRYGAPNIETPEERYIRVYKQNEELYQRLIDASIKTLEFTKQAINNLDAVEAI